ncbi:helix-turn-helix domain-containing protein [Nocardioides ultimimeridianus]
MTEQIAKVIQQRVAAYAGAQSDWSGAMIVKAVRVGITDFVDRIAGERTHRAEVDDVFQKVGRTEALSGRSLEHLRSTMLIATRCAWLTIHRTCRDYDIPDGMLGRIGDALFAHMDHLEQQMTLGHRAAVMELQHDSQRWRGSLAAELLAESPTRDVAQLAAHTGWRLPDLLQVIAISTPRDEPMPDLSGLPEAALVHRAHPVSAVIGSPETIERARHRLVHLLGSGTSAATSWPVAVQHGASAFRWASRALQLRHLGVIPGTGMIECVDFVAQLWVNSEPLMRELVIQRELAPLLSEAPRSRQVLSETLLLLLETGGSAPALAARLGVHPQTVRYRMRRLRELFGDRLDADENLTLLLALRATLPRWRAGYLDEEPQPAA